MWHDRIGVVKRQTAKPGAIIIVLLSMVAWFAASKHCALAVLTPAENVLAMHANCHGNPPEPAKNTDNELPCCKVLRATVVAKIEVPASEQTALVPAQNFFVAELLSIDEQDLQPLPEEIDTGPPFVSSFAELILQESLFSHAPPSLV